MAGVLVIPPAAEVDGYIGKLLQIFIPGKCRLLPVVIVVGMCEEVKEIALITRDYAEGRVPSLVGQASQPIANIDRV